MSNERVASRPPGATKVAGCGRSIGEALDGAEGHYVESLSDAFRTGVFYIDVRQCKGTDHFAKEGGFLLIGLDEGKGDVRGPEFDGESGEAGARAEVGHTGVTRSLRWTLVDGQVRASKVPRGTVGEQVAGGEEGFAEVASDDFFFAADGGEVDASVPTLEYIDVRRYMMELSRGQDSRFLTGPLALFGMTRI